VHIPTLCLKKREQNCETESRRYRGSLENVMVTAMRFDYYVGITNRERLFGSNQRVKLDRG